MSTPIFAGPEPVPDWEKLNDADAITRMKEHLQIAVTLELHTVPLYLFALYSVNEGNSDAAINIKQVSKEEMLHFALAGNILCSIGGKPMLYGERYIPKYPVRIFNDNLQLNLRGTTNSNLETFVQLERPTFGPYDGVENNILPRYFSIGEFYDSIERGLIRLHRTNGDGLFQRAPLARQFRPGDGSHRQMISINSLESARRAMKLIIDQGEGSSGADGHYQIFQRLRDAGVPHHNVVENPETESFRDKPFYKAMVACDAAYCYLLSTIEILWTYDGNQRDRIIRNNITGLMFVIKVISKYLIRQDAGNGKKAAPCFNLYARADLLPRLAQLKRETDAAVEASSELREIKQRVDDLVDVFNL